jgi:hypothetical protein
MEWNETHTKLLQKWSKKSKVYAIMHTVAAQHYTNWNKRLGVPVVILGAITASSIFSTSHQDSSATFQTRQLINGGLALSMTVLTGVNRFMGFAEKRVEHMMASMKHTKISMNIDTLLSFTYIDRSEGPDIFINKTKTMIFEVRENSPDLPTWVIHNFIAERKTDCLIDLSVDVHDSKSETNISVPSSLLYLGPIHVV